MTEPSAAVVRARMPTGFVPEIALILGSGLGPLADAVAEAVVIPYAKLPGFPQPSVPGHGGTLHLGHLGGVPVVCLKGRAHFYEGHGSGVMRPAIAALAELGCRGIVLTNAAGSLDADMPPGSLMMLNDHINFAGTNPLIGDRGPDGGPIFLPMTDLYDRGIREIFAETAAGQDIDLFQGVYVWFTGPIFETPAEIRAARILGGHAVGMSTVPEAILARRYGMKVAAFSNITNLGAGMAPDETLSHHLTIDRARIGAAALQNLLIGGLPAMAALLRGQS
ncbi:MAG: purine-nucleoside phosphorylase [Alphaproteobacteria bacterium]|jgi:purine-nucleoside phosphorylase|nr:purine-nucleoside phosphorylase [Alphaproteobacteria bacterium]